MLRVIEGWYWTSSASFRFRGYSFFPFLEEFSHKLMVPQIFSNLFRNRGAKKALSVRMKQRIQFTSKTCTWYYLFHIYKLTHVHKGAPYSTSDLDNLGLERRFQNSVTITFKLSHKTWLTIVAGAGVRWLESCETNEFCLLWFKGKNIYNETHNNWGKI